MEKFHDQVRRFEEVAKAKEPYSFNCDLCPLRDQCLPWCEKMAEQGRAIDGVSCEDTLTYYIIHGDFLCEADP